MDFSQKIDREELREIFQRPFDPETWKALLIQVFGANKLYQQPKPRELDNGENAKVQGYDLGEIVTPDKYTIGLFQFEIKSGHKIPMNRVGLRGLVEKEIKYFYDAALVVYYNESQWRLSFICDLRDEKTAPKRFTYVFGDKDRSYRTPISRFEYIKSKGASKDVIHEAFSVEALNKEFYGFIAKRFYQLVGATTGTGKNKTEHERIMQLPGEQDNLVYQEFAVRLIGRTVFCWFLKEKKSKDGVPLLPHALLSSDALKEYKDYYHTVLERIFFQTLNTPNTPKDRVKGLPKGCELIPFLNGGLFDYRPHDFYAPEEDGLSKHRNELTIPDEWFAALFAELEQYNFTIDENSPDDIEVSVDPEMLGRIFENLLAEIDPDSGETARKATGSFYTPREIVDYMAVESLIYYLSRKTGIESEKLYPLFKSTETAEYTTQERENLLVALDELKILDPACGSGAFPMGVLAKITGALHILDKDGAWWKERQLQRIDNAKVRQEMQQKLDTATVEYARKIGIIQNTLYGVDIQPIAAEISKLRCFLTLIVDENVDDSKSNRGVDPLPNLEFKFITANSLMKLPPANIFGAGATDDIEQLRQLRIDYLQSYGAAKVKIKEKFRAVQQKIYNDQAGNASLDTNSREYKISRWDPFGNEKSDWFDSEWMFGIAGGFDIIIANPPYVNIKRGDITPAEKQYYSQTYKTAQGQYDLFAIFIERALSFGRCLAFIVPKPLINNENYQECRKLILTNGLQEIVIGSNVFENAAVESCVFFSGEADNETIAVSVAENGIITHKHGVPKNILDGIPFSIIPTEITDSNKHIFTKLNSTLTLLGGIANITRGVEAGKSDDSITSIPNEYKLIRGEDMGRYSIKFNDLYCSFDLSDQAKYKSKELYSSNKILLRRVGNTLMAVYDIDKYVVLNSIYCLQSKDSRFSPIFLTGILNSKLIGYWFKHLFTLTDKLFPYIRKSQLEFIPIADTTGQADEVISTLALLQQYISSGKPIDWGAIAPTAAARAIDKVLDACVFELYFPEEMKQQQIDVIEPVAAVLGAIEPLSSAEKIVYLYNEWSDYKNDIRNRTLRQETRNPNVAEIIKSM